MEFLNWEVDEWPIKIASKAGRFEEEMVAKGVHQIHKLRKVEYSTLPHLAGRCRAADKYEHVVA